MSSSNCCFLTCIQISQESGQVAWYSHLFQNFPQFIVIHTVKGFGIVSILFLGMVKIHVPHHLVCRKLFSFLFPEWIKENFIFPTPRALFLSKTFFTLVWLDQFFFYESASVCSLFKQYISSSQENGQDSNGTNMKPDKTVWISSQTWPQGKWVSWICVCSFNKCRGGIGKDK